MNGLLIVAHGSEHGNEDIERLVERISGSFEGPVSIGYKRFGEPRLRDGLDLLVSEKADRIIAVPLFMSDGKYVGSIPVNLGLERGKLSGTIMHDGRSVRISVTEPVGLHREFPSVVADLVDRCRPDADGVVLLEHGSDPRPEVSGTLESLGLTVRTTSGPVREGLPTAIDSLRRDGCSRIIVVQMRVTPRDVTGLVDEDVIVTPPAGTSEGASGLILRMADEAARRRRPSVQLLPYDVPIQHIEGHQICDHHGHGDPWGLPPQGR